MLALLFPLGLAAFAALVVPALIHLARRSEERRTDFAALRWLRQQPKPRQRLRFDEWPLLLLRLLLLALLALWLAHPAWHGEAAPARWLVAVPGIDAGQVRSAAAGDEARWLAPGFPPLEEMPLAGEVPVASLLRQLDAELPVGAMVTVLVPEHLSGLDGERPKLSRAVTWRVLPGAMPAARPAPTAIPPLAVRYAPDRASGLRYLRAAAIAWRPSGRPPAYKAAPAGAALPDRSSVLVWLVPGPLSATVVDWIRRGGTALVDAAAAVPADEARVVAWHDPSGAPLVDAMALGRGRLLQLRRPLTPAAMPLLLEPDFPRRLRDLLAPSAAPSTARAEDVVPLPGGRRYPQPARDLQPRLATLIALLFAVERWFATRRTRRVAP